MDRVAPPGLAQRDEQGVELFYNAALTPWCHLTGDLQVVEPSSKNLQTTVLAGMRLEDRLVMRWRSCCRRL